MGVSISMESVEERCQVNRCQETAEYGLFKTYPDGEKKWLHVCEKCEEEIGSDNIRRVGGVLRQIKRRISHG